MAADGKITVQVTLDEADFRRSMSGLPNTANQGLHKTTAIFETFRMAVNKIWSMIADSVSSAISRLDTMDQFSRVMTTMLGSTEKANKALDATSNIVKGTAFGLDTAASSVQGFVSAGIEVSKATDTMDAWADAVAFYTKGTNEDLGRVGVALQKMQTKGTATMEHISMLLEAGIPVVEIYASAVGMSADEVTDAMSKGEISTSDFLNAKGLF